VWAFGWFGNSFTAGMDASAIFLLFGSLLTIGQAIQFRRTIKNQPFVDKY
jgi:hypothetical protein